MSLAGVRDISVIETPPEGRRPVKTYVGEYDEELVKQALEREHERGGQAFFLHNRVETIDETAERLRGLCPGMRFEVAHGQMERERARAADAGVPARRRRRARRAPASSSPGIDIPQANTLIVERADAFGLAQLYQIRGRVGRSRERAYAYLLYPSAAALTAGGGAAAVGAVGLHRARRRLQDRDARPGDPRRRQPARRRAVRPRRGARASSCTCRCSTRRSRRPSGEASRTSWEPVRLDVNVDAYVPSDYIPYEQAKVDVHRRIAGAREVADLVLLREELEDRFGERARAAAQPDRAPAGADQARAGGRARGDVPQRPAGGDADRARLRARQEDPRARSPRRCTSRASRSCRCACPRTRPSASRRSSRRPTCCWR